MKSYCCTDCSYDDAIGNLSYLLSFISPSFSVYISIHSSSPRYTFHPALFSRFLPTSPLFSILLYYYSHLLPFSHVILSTPSPLLHLFSTELLFSLSCISSSPSSSPPPTNTHTNTRFCSIIKLCTN